ncbi:hypothetical protein AM609_00680 [Actinomyces sp. oral taxon 414]|uniref:DUF4143 domain-containing protein n=1 Tax=Actinomyces sp. oral taxon 414 TaxID=712122 RepID=UPI0006AF59D9|nr:DUF4143 domain-containing protein [Actinomyces sp. oral taxon 414]ALC98363.1 hypothetical protein AM609_00680 [Actinomyces sp. oral taxon 414]
MPHYRRRAIEATFAQRASHRVAILEGRRAVGKSSLARHLVESGVYASYQSLTDPAAAGRAQEDAFQWVRSLRRPAVIDEAQMVPAVSVAVKEIVDGLPPGHHFLLTGSASVGRGTMAGTDPLAGRATRLALHPFTGLEAQGPSDSETPSLIDILFDADLTAAEAPSTGTDDLRTRLETGGLPAFALPLLPLSRAAWQNQVQADTLAILGDRVLPTEDLNTGIARRVLDSVLHTPGGQINRTRIARELDLDARTVGRYLGILERRFLITLLPNLHGGITRASRSAPKGHAVDTASTCESLIRAGHDIADSPELLGQTLETWVVNQFLAARGWAALTTEAFYWRDSRTGREVDLVLVDGRGRRLGVEVKLASSIGPSDLRGLRAMREFGGLHRGFVAYTGAGFEEVDDGVWALPLACLTSREALSAIHSDGVGRPSPGTAPSSSSVRSTDPGQETTTMSDAPSTTPAVLPRPSVFLSYVHADDDYHDGMLVAFARAVKEACDYKGVPIELIVDKDALQWGDDWSERLQQEVERTTFLLAMVTNRYVASQACREEFIQFRTKTQAAGYNGLLTLLVDAPNWDRMDLRADPTARLIRDTINQHQWLEPETSFEDLEPGGRRFKQVAREVANELIRRIDRREADSAPADTAASADSAAPGGPSGAGDEGEDEEQAPGLIELTHTIESERRPALERRANAFGEAMDAFTAVTRREFALIPQGSAPTSTQIKRIAKGLEPRRRALEEATSSLSDAWRGLDADIAAMVRAVDAAGVAEFSAELRSSLTGLSASLEMPVIGEAAARIKALAALSRELRPVAKTMTGVLAAIEAIKASATAWAQEL